MILEFIFAVWFAGLGIWAILSIVLWVIQKLQDLYDWVVWRFSGRSGWS